MLQSPCGLHWFRHDLRITDNQALAELSGCTEKMIGVYIFDPKWDDVNQWGCTHLGPHRRAFVEHSLLDLRQRLRSLGSDLLILYADPVLTLTQLVIDLRITHLSYEMHAGFYERRQAEQLTAKIASSQSPDTKPYTKLICGWSNYLYHQKDLPFSLENMPDTFSPFRKKIEKYAKSSVLSSELKSLGLLSLKPANLPEYKFRIKQQKGVFDTAIAANDCSAAYGDSYAGQYGGGETAALGRIEDYFFSSDRIAQYKETRNGLDGWQFSSRLSAFLALGCVSPRTVNAKLKEYESQRGANESTYWLYFELLWREFFHLQHIKHGAAFFALGGIQQSQPQTNHKTATFEQWCSGKTGYDIVDACMHQLNATGFMSNRGRQLVASCFVHELQLDWRYGAAYFEQQLVDFDVASNWGNWQYLAGVGSDSRGHRQFNLQKQTDIYDPNHAFIKSWLPSK